MNSPYLFERFPALAAHLPWISLGQFPTPVEPLKGLALNVGAKSLYIKRDDQTGDVYGGNKVRKLEFLIADALKKGATHVVTSGGAGSNHALATALYAQATGLKASLLLFDQPNARSVRENLLTDLWAGASLHHSTDYESYRRGFAEQIVQISAADGSQPYVIAPGGSSLVGTIGYVNAGLELATQIDRGVLPVPNEIYAAFGTMGTIAGLLLGLRSAGLRSHIQAIRVVPSFVASMQKFLELFDATNRMLHDFDYSFPVCTIDNSDITIRDEFLGAGYGIFTEESVRAVADVKKCDDVSLDETYTGKAMAALIHDCQRDRTGSAVRLFWNTKNSRPLPKKALSFDFHLLPQPFHHYFTTTAQDDS